MDTQTRLDEALAALRWIAKTAQHPGRAYEPGEASTVVAMVRNRAELALDELARPL